jgi:hypothetical protein
VARQNRFLKAYASTRHNTASNRASADAAKMITVDLAIGLACLSMQRRDGPLPGAGIGRLNYRPAMIADNLC